MTRSSFLPYALIAPSVAFLAAFFLVPLVETVWLSFATGSGASLDNYRRMAQDLNFGTAIANTFLLTLVVVPLEIALALAMATMVAKLGRGRELALWVLTIPLGVSDLAAGLAWLAILQNSGYLNSALYALGLIPGQVSWLSQETPFSLFAAIALAEIWRATAIVLVILIAGLQLIPKEFGEAAEIFGAKPWTRFRTITLPLLKPSLQSALILRTVLAFEVFAVVYALGGRNFPVLAGEAYTWQNENQNYGVAAAYAVLIMAVSLTATAVSALPSARRLLLWSGLAVLFAWVLLPIYLVALGAFGGRLGVFRWPKSIWPSDLTLQAMQQFLAIEGVFSALMNSLIAAGFTVLFSILLGAPAGYALARYAFRGQNAYRLLVLLTRAFPLAILALPLTVSFIRFGLYDTPFGVSLIHTVLALPFAALVTQSLFMGIPREYEEAAWVFGCNRLQAFLRVVLPLALPGLAATAIFAFVISWNEVFAASILTVRNRTLTAYLLKILSESPLHYRLAGGFVLILPSVLFIFAVRRYLFAVWGIASK